MSSVISDPQREAFVRRVRVEMARLGLTRQALADKAGCKERTLGNLLAGQSVRDVTLAKVAKVLAIPLDDVFNASGPISKTGAAAPDGTPDGRAADAYGGYQLADFEAYLGTYTAYRWVFSGRPEIARSIYEIDWDEDLRRLRFFELQRFEGAAKKTVSSSHAGGIHISPLTGLLHLLTTYRGALRLVTLSKFRMGDTRLRGVILTQSDRDLYFQPAVSAIFLDKLEGRRKTADLERLIGKLVPKDSAYGAAASELKQIAESAVYFAGVKSLAPSPTP